MKGSGRLPFAEGSGRSPFAEGSGPVGGIARAAALALARKPERREEEVSGEKPPKSPFAGGGIAAEAAMAAARKNKAKEGGGS